MPKKVLTTDDMAYIRENYLEYSAKAMSGTIGCGAGVVQRYLRKNGLTVPRETVIKFRADAMRGRTNFTAEEDAFIHGNYLKMPIKTLAAQMGRSHCGVLGRMKAMGFEVPRETVRRNRESSWIKKGHVPANKGKKQVEYMSAEMIQKTEATRFKKGHITANEKYDGAITVRHESSGRNNQRAYKWIRLAKCEWEPLHKHLWEKANGPVPEGHCLWFRDGDSLNCSMDNIELITRKENYARNHPAKRLGDRFVARCLVGKCGDPSHFMDRPELLELKRQQIKLNRKIKQNDNHGN